jgi:hypothetical protein
VEDLVTRDPRTGHPSRILLPEIFCLELMKGTNYLNATRSVLVEPWLDEWSSSSDDVDANGDKS